MKHGGSYSAKLESKFASMLGIGQFAAGNVFSGKYLATNMDGVVGNGVLVGDVRSNLVLQHCADMSATNPIP